MDNFGGGVLCGALGALLFVLAMIFAVNAAQADRMKEAVKYRLELKEKIAQCEATLPRNETCVLVARKKEA